MLLEAPPVKSHGRAPASGRCRLLRWMPYRVGDRAGSLGEELFVNPLFLSSMAAARRAMRDHQGVPPSRPALPLWRLLLGELVYGFHLLRRPRRLLPALALAAAVGVGLSPATPGPVAEPVLRGFVAFVAGGLGAWAGSVVSVAGGRGGTDRGRGGPARGVAVVLMMAAGVLAAGLLISAVVAVIF